MNLTTVRNLLASIAMSALAVVASEANGAMLVSDSFTYADGSLNGKDPAIGGVWGAHSGTAGQVQVTGGKIGIVQSTQSEDVNIPFEGAYVLGAGGVLYSGFDLTVAAPTGAVADVYFAMFLTGTANFDARVWMTAPTTSGYRLAISNDNSITDADGEVRTGDLAFGTTYRVVTKYDFDAKKGTLWIDPVNEASASFSASDPGFSDAAIAYAFREATGNTAQVIDNLLVGTTFTEAAGGVEVPEPTCLMLVALGGVLCLARRQSR